MHIGHHNIKEILILLEEACKIYYVKLIKGQSFYAFDHRFLMSEEEEVSEKVYNYLRRNEFFEVRKKNIRPNYKKHLEKHPFIVICS